MHCYLTCQSTFRLLKFFLLCSRGRGVVLLLQTALAAAVVSGFSELLLLMKAVAVAVGAPDQVLPDPALPGVSGLLCSFVSIVTSLCSSLVTGMLLRWLITEKGRSVGKKADEETGTAGSSADSSVRQPLLSPGTSSWDLPQNDKVVGSSADEDEAGSSAQHSTVLELLKLSVADTPLLIGAFTFGVGAALMAACVPYFTGLIIDYASIDPDRWAWARWLGWGL